MGPKKAAAKSPSKSNKSPAKKTPPTHTQDSQAAATGPTSTQSIPTQASTQSALTQPTPKPFTFKGHPQPPADERLFAAKNFLADEDPDRCLRFDTKITQVEELVAQIEKDNVSCDPGLFRDVKVKLKVHRDWEARRKTSPFDTGCCEAPLIAPFSTRLISAETAASLRQERETQGLVTQMRTDHAPFSVNPEDDHGAFLAKMREDSMTDPNEIDQDTNLLWTESRAYLWAMRDPSMIPFWMHPTNGIPTKGIKAADSRNRLYVPVFDSVKNRRPSRGWIPAHVAATETKINELLSIQAPSSEEFAQLQELLCPFEPIDLHELHKQDESFTEAAILGHLSANQRSAQAQIKARFDNAWRSWVNSLASHGVYFIIRTPGEPEVLDQPGVLYVNDGIMTLEHLDTLEKAQSLLDRLLANGRMDLTEQESASLDSLMQYSLPINILEVQREILRILEVQGANSVSDLDQEYQAKVTDLEKAEQERKLRWEDELKQSGGAEFCYVRPAEMKHNKNIILYLPWDLIAIPQVPVQARPDLQLLPEVQKLQDDVNKDLPRNINLPSIDRGSLQFRKSLEQLVYLDLRDLLTPYFALRQKEAAGPPLTSDEARQYDVLAAAVHHLWEAWWHGLGKKITIKMPRAEQENKPPGVMYCRDPSNKPIGEDLETFFTRKAASVNQILARHASQTSGTEPPEYFSELYVLCRDLQYPALKILEEQYRSAGTEKKSKRLQHDWEVAFKHWIQSKKGHTIQIKMPNPRIDPDDDPSVVYYRGPLLTPSDFPGLSEDIKNRIQTTRTSPVSTFPIGLRSQLPPLLQRLIEAHERWNSPESETILEWHLEAFMNAPTPSKPVSLTLNRSNPHSPTAIALMEVSNDDSHSYLTEMPFLSPVWSQGQPAQLDVDLTALLPEIRAIELEINRLLAMFGGGGMPLYLDKADAVTTVLRHLDDHKRLTILLQQFWPNPVYQRWHRAEQYKKLLRIVGRYGHQISTQEYENTVAACDEAFLIAHNSWLTELRSTGVHIQTSPEEAHPLDKVTLIFQPGTSLKATKTHPEPTFCVLTPETTAGSEVQTSKLVYRSVYDTPPSSTSVNYNALLRAHLAALETRINVLLQKRSSSEWTWDESEVLLGHLRAFMSPFLAELDPKLRSLDEKARREKLTEHETRNWHQMWQDWHRGYGSWLDGLPHDGIVIDKGDQIGSDSGVLKLRIEDSSVLQPISRPKNLPLPLKSREDLMNRLLSDHTARSDKNRWHLDQILASLLRPILQKFRYLVQDHIRLGICKRTGKDSEDDALMEALISLGQTLLMERIFKSEATCRIQILEPVPGDYLINAIDSSGAVIFPVSEMEEVTLAQQLFDQLCPPYLDDSKIMFHDLAFRIRTDIAQNQEDLDFLTQNIPDISTREITTLTARALELLGPFQEQGIDESQVQKELADALARMCWKILMSMHQDQDEKIRNILGNPIIPNQTPVLIARRLPGASPLSPPPLVAPPNEVEIKELEIEINNLLSREKIKTINKEQQQKLNYLLRALLPPRLRFLKNRIDDLDRQYLAKDGLDLRDSLELADAQDQFDPQFEQWKQSISDLGIVLDHWLCTPAAIAEGCSRARQWKKFTTKSDGSTISGDIGVYLEDMNVKQCHDIYDTLRDFVEAGCRSPSEVTDQLQLRVVPQEIINQINQITAQTQLVQACTDPEKTPKAMLWQTMKDQLIKSYVKWLVGLIPMQRQRLWTQAKGAYDGEVDFAPKAERRGIQRAAIELALNLLATNQEQHRPKDRFRMVDLPSTIKIFEKEVPLCMPLRPDERPLEQDPLEYTRKMLAFRRWKDYDYGLARLRIDRSGSLPAPDNFLGPASIATVDDIHTAARTQLNNLASIQKGLIEAVKAAPRPLLEQLLLLVDAGVNQLKLGTHPLDDEEELTTDGVDLLEEIAGESWDEARLEYGDMIPGVQNTPEDRGRLEEFEIDIAEIADLPLWEPSPQSDPMDEDSFEHFTQTEYDPTMPSTSGMAGDEVRQAIGNRRMAKTGGTAGTPHLWDLKAVTRYLKAMESVRRIHLDDLPNGDVRVSRIPLSGHPENKYAVSRAAVSSSPGVRYDEEGKFEVRYDAFGRVGPHILQPNKFYYLQRLAFRLGRDLKKNAQAFAEAPEPKERVNCQLGARAAAEAEMDNILPADRSEQPWIFVDPPPRNINLQRLAQDLHKMAPDLAQEAGLRITSPTEITERQAATLLQMQVLEEASNNWEFKFPEKEHVWDFASDRLETTTRTINGRSVQGMPRLAQYFHMRRFPPCCQSTATKEIMKQSGPVVQEKPEPVVQQAAYVDTQSKSKPKVRHIRGREPYFSLGESAYEKAFLSWRMEQELMDVPEFQVPKKRRSWWQFGKDKDDERQQDRRDRYPLPKIPAHWVPDSVSITEKRAHVLELAKRTPAFPNPEVLGYYHTPREIEQIKLHRQWRILLSKEV